MPQISELPSLDAIRAAHARIKPHIHKTPLLTSRFLGETQGAQVFLKAENLQRAGSFKIRGALNALLTAQARGEIGPAGVITYSSGNHGQAVALAAGIVGCLATIVVPEDIARVKRRAIEGYGGRVVPCGLTSEDRHQGALRRARETGEAIIPPYDHPDIIAGQGTVALEILEDLKDLNAVVVPVGGGGLIAGVSLGIKALCPEAEVIGAEPDTSNDLALSLARGTKVSVPPSKTIADGLRALTPGDLTFEAARRFVSEVWCVPDTSILQAQRILLERAKLLVEPSGAISAAAFLQHGARLRGKSVVLVLSGGNVDLPDEEQIS